MKNLATRNSERRVRRLLRSAILALALTGTVAPVLLADEAPVPAPATAPKLTERLGPSSRIAIAPPAVTQPTTRPVEVAPSSTRGILPSRREVKGLVRPLHEPLSRIRESADFIDRPSIASMPAGALPSTPGFAEGPRVVVTPVSSALVIRLPNLLISAKRAIYSSANPLMTPASPVSTPPVTNSDGTTAMSILPPLTRQIQVEVAPNAAPLSIEETPTLSLPEAPDGQDIPALSIDKPSKLQIE